MKKLIILLALLSLAVSCGKDKATSSDKSVKSVTLSRNLMMLGTGIDFPLTAVSDPLKDDATKYIYLPITGNPNYALGAYTYEISHVNSDVNYDIHTGSTSVRTGSLYIRAVMTKWR